MQNIFGTEPLKDEKIRNLVLDKIRGLMDQQITQKIDSLVNKRLQHHVDCHQVDPTLLSLIQSFVPGMRSIELKKEQPKLCKKGFVDRNRKKNHAQFRKVYTADGLNMDVDAQCVLAVPNYHLISETDVINKGTGSATHSGQKKQQFKANDIFDILSADDKDLIEKSFLR